MRIFAALSGVLLLSGAAGPGPAGAEASDTTARQKAAEALSDRAEAGDAEAIAALVPLLHATDSKVRYHADWGLTRAGAPAVPVLTEDFERRRDDAERARVARALGRIGLAARGAAPLMREALSAPDSQTAGAAAAALGSMRALEALPDLERAYAASRRIPNQRQIGRAFRAMGSDQAIRRSKEALIASVERDLAQTDLALRDEALAYTAELYHAQRTDSSHDLPTRQEMAPLVPYLIAGLEDPDPDRLPAIMRAVALAGATAADAVPLLEPRLWDPITHHQARKTLEQIGTPEAQRVLARHAAFEALEKRIRSDYSVQDHQGRTRLLPIQVSGSGARGVRMDARFLYPGRVPARPERVVLYFESTSEEPRLEDLAHIEWLADGRRILMSDLDRTWSRGKGAVIERVSGTLALSDFLALVESRELRARVGPVELTLAEPNHDALRHFASKIPPPPAADSGP